METVELVTQVFVLVLVGVVLWMLQRSGSKWDRFEGKFDRHEESNSKAFQRVHERIDRVANEQNQLQGYLSGWRNGTKGTPK